jgi:hypothetical protein
MAHAPLHFDWSSMLLNRQDVQRTCIRASETARPEAAFPRATCGRRGSCSVFLQYLLSPSVREYIFTSILPDPTLLLAVMKAIATRQPTAQDP